MATKTIPIFFFFFSILFIASLAIPNQVQAVEGEDGLAGAVIDSFIHPNDFPYGFREGSLHPQECNPRCSNRCSRTSFKKPCMFFCQKCCAKCLCVPPGTYGNKQVCPCYNNWKTKEGGPKCP